MELALSLGDTPKPFSFSDKPQKMVAAAKDVVGFCMALGQSSTTESKSKSSTDKEEKRGSSDPPLQLDLLPFFPVPRRQTSPTGLSFSWLSNNFSGEVGCSNIGRGKRVDRLNSRSLGLVVENKGGGIEDGRAMSSPNSTASSFQMDLSMYKREKSSKRDLETNEIETDRGGASSRVSDEEDNGLTRKKLRLTKDQSAFLEESFKEHSTLNPKQKLALAKELNLRPRQVEVWFQNRRARTKLKQTEVDCEYLKRCCEKLTEENRKLQLRALKSSQPFYMQLPATTLTICPSCERVTARTTTLTTSNATNTLTTVADSSRSSTSLSLAKSIRMVPFSPAQVDGSHTALLRNY